MRKIIFILIIIFSIILTYINVGASENLETSLQRGLSYLKLRKDNLALKEFENILKIQSDHCMALWGKAEVLRRSHKYQEAEEILNRVLSKEKNHPACLISLAYIRYHDGKFQEASALLKEVLDQPRIDKENKAIVYMLMGSINATRAKQCKFLFKVVYGTHIMGYFKKANELAPDLAEVHLGMGTFYLLAPKIIGGNLDKAQEELECAVKLTPDFATANARLAQTYKKKGDIEKYEFYLQRAKELDLENEILSEIEKADE